MKSSMINVIKSKIIVDFIDTHMLNTNSYHVYYGMNPLTWYLLQGWK